MGYEQILFDLEDRVATITLNRPEVLNAYQPRMGDELVDAFRRARDDRAVRAVILTGAGRAFCAGVDLGYLKEQRARIEKGERLVPLGEEHFVKGFAPELAAFPKPVIAAIRGAAIGVGVTMTLPCDIRLAAEDAVLGLPFTKLGMIPGLGSTHLLPRIVGMAAALELVLTSQSIGAEQAARIRLVNRVVPGERLLGEARELASRAADCDPAAIAAAKQALHFGATASLDAAMARERSYTPSPPRSRA